MRSYHRKLPSWGVSECMSPGVSTMLYLKFSTQYNPSTVAHSTPKPWAKTSVRLHRGYTGPLCGGGTPKEKSLRMNHWKSTHTKWSGINKPCLVRMGRTRTSWATEHKDKSDRRRGPLSLGTRPPGVLLPHKSGRKFMYGHMQTLRRALAIITFVARVSRAFSRLLS